MIQIAIICLRNYALLLCLVHISNCVATYSNISTTDDLSQPSHDHGDRARLLRSSLFRPSLFHIVTFPNDECYDSSNQSGTCYTAAECKAYGGSGTASCAKGYGTCCIISRSCHNTTSQKVVYFKNPSYPQMDTQQNFCDLTIEVKDPDVCQIRLDLLDLQLDSPTDGECLGDKFTISASGLATGSIPTLCGLNRNQHFYVNLPQGEKERSASLLFMTNSNGGYRWHIRATQIQCITEDDGSRRRQRKLFQFSPRASLKVSVPAPPGCLQYFTSSNGVIESFNFGQYLNNLDYAICIERLSNTCRVTFTSATGDWAIARSDGVNFHLSGVGDLQCSTDYLMIPAASRAGDGRTYDRFCGGALNYQENREINAPVVTKAKGPIVLRFHSGRLSPASNNVESRSGFRLRFEQSDTNCLSETGNTDYLEMSGLGPMSVNTALNGGPGGSANGAYPYSMSNYPLQQKSRYNAKRLRL